MGEMFTGSLIFTLAFVTILIVLAIGIVQFLRVRRSQAKRHETPAMSPAPRHVVVERERTATEDPALDR